MRRAALAILSTVSALVVLLSFKTHSPISTPAAAISPATTGNDNTAGGSSPTPTSSASSAPHASSATKTVTGTAVNTAYGPVQVQITVKNGTVTGVKATEYPLNDPRDQQINAYAIPALNQEALAAQSAQIDTISGATYTSEGYLGSLQSALDQAGL